jgi:hypothetical protein
MPTTPLSSDVAIRKWRPAIDGEARSTGGRDGLYVRGWRSGSKAFYFRTETWLKIGEYPDTSLAKAREPEASIGKIYGQDKTLASQVRQQIV